MKTHEIVYFPESGATSLRNLATGESMHSRIGPWEEAHQIYVEQSELSTHLGAEIPETLVIFDIGLGLAANSLAVLENHARLGSKRRVHLVSFENDLSGLALAAEVNARNGSFSFFAGYESAIECLLSRGSWSSPDGLLNWTLKNGDFHSAELGNESPRLIYYDFYSPKSCPALWTVENFRRLRELTQKEGEHSQLYTYSVATSVRVALLLAGFYVGYGTSTSAKLETTIAATRLEDLQDPLGQRWLDRLSRSGSLTPYDCHSLTREVLIDQIVALPQFQPSGNSFNPVGA